MKEPIYSIARLSHVHESSKELNSGFYFVLSSGAAESAKYGSISLLTRLFQFSIFY